MDKPAILVYGNCQAHALQKALIDQSLIRSSYDILYLPSFVHPITGPYSLDATDADRIVVVIEQRGLWARFDYCGMDRIKRISFPTAALSMLWPLHVKDRRNGVDEEYPFGRYPYGDRFVSKVLAEGLSGTDALQRYEELDLEKFVNLKRFSEIEMQRIQDLDKECDIRLGAWVLENFKDQPLFWSYNHPRAVVLVYLAQQVIGLLTDHFSWDRKDLQDVVSLDEWAVVAALRVPIHPQVRDYFQLTWSGERETYAHYCHHDLSAQDYLLHLINFD